MAEQRRIRTVGGIGIAGLVLGAALLALAAFELSFSLQHTLFLAFCFGAAATGWGLFAGFGGQFSFGHAAIFGLSAYGAYFLNHWWNVTPLYGVVIASVVTSIASLIFVVPALRLRGPYFALVTLALAEIARRWIETAREQTGGQDGKLLPFTGDGVLELSSRDKQDFVRWAAVLVVFSITVCWLFVRSRRGRELTAIRDEQDIAASTGVNTTYVKVIGFLVSAVLTGLAGGLYAYSSHIVSTDALLTATVSILILEVAVVGGIRSVFGPAIGAIFLISIQEFLRVRFGSSSPSAYRLVFAGIFGIMLFVAPSGLVGVAKSTVARRTHRKRRGSVAEVTGAADAARDTSLGNASADGIQQLLRDLAPLERHAKITTGAVELRADGLAKKFGAVTVNDDVSFKVAAMTTLGIWGPNGSGKSTLINVIGGQLAPDGGQITFGDDRVERLPPHRRAGLGIVRASQQAKLYDSQTVTDNLLVTIFSTKKLNPLRQRDHRRAHELVITAMDAVGLPPRLARQNAGELSTGQRKRLEIARVLVGHRPRLLLLDEPTAGVDAAGIPQLIEVLKALKIGTGASVIVVDHDIDFLLQVVDSFLFLERGRVLEQVAVNSDRLHDRLRSHMAVQPDEMMVTP